MGLRCLLGHDFTEPRTERDREERGDEVVVTITEVKECRRCGETRVVSENKEVTSLTTRTGFDADGTVEAESSDAGPSDAGSVGADGSPAPDVGATEGADVVDDGASPDGDDFDHPTADPAAEAADVEEDAEIIDAPADAPADDDADTDADTESDGRAHGEWPDADANRTDPDAASSDEPAAWPDDERPTAGDGADAPDDGSGEGAHSPAEGEAEDVEFIGGDAPEPEDAAATEARTDVVPDADRADEAGAAGGDDAEFVDGDGPGAWPE